MTAFRGEWGDIRCLLVQVEAEYGLDGYADVLAQELAYLDELIDRQGVGAAGEGKLRPGFPAPCLRPTASDPRDPAASPRWRLRDLPQPTSRMTAMSRLVWRMLGGPRWRAKGRNALQWAGEAFRGPVATQAVAEAVGSAGRWVYLSPNRLDLLPRVLRQTLPWVAWERVGIDAEAAPELRDVVRVPLTRLHPLRLEGWASYVAPFLEDGAVLCLQRPHLAVVLAALAGKLHAPLRLLVVGEPSAAERSGWTSSRRLATDLWLLEGAPAALIAPPRPQPASWPRISVVTISYNQAAFLEATLRSVLDQGYPNLEYIVIDGGSTDGSAEILERYRDRLAHLVIEPDKGQSDALNKGFARASGDILTWLCSDDLLEPGALFRVAEAFQRFDVDLVAGGCRLVDAAGRQTFLHHNGLPLEHPVPLSFGDLCGFCGVWQKGMYFFQPDVFFSRRIWENAGALIKPHLYYAMDYDLFLRFALAGARVVHIPEVLAGSRVHDAQKTRHDDMLYLPTIRQILQEYATLVDTAKTCSRHRTGGAILPSTEGAGEGAS